MQYGHDLTNKLFIFHATMDQKELVSIYNTLKPLLKEYEKKGFKPKIDLDSKYDLWSLDIDIFAFKKQRTEMYFAWLIIQSNYVGFYFMPITVDPKYTKIIGKDLLATLKGKSCFHIKKLDDTIIKQIKDALAEGYKLYKERGWI